MRQLTAFDSITLDGFFTDAKGDISWAHEGADDPEFNAFTADNAKGGGTLVFGRITYEMMAAYWPTPAAARDNPVVAEQMTRLEKVVFSRSLREPKWENTRVVSGDPVAEMRKLKAQSGPAMVIMGSGTIVAQLARAGLIDAYQLVVCPVVLGEGRTLFDGLRSPLGLRLVGSRTFRNGKVFASYERKA